MTNNLEKEIRKIQGLVGEHSFTVVLPKKYATNIDSWQETLEISKLARPETPKSFVFNQ